MAGALTANIGLELLPESLQKRTGSKLLIPCHQHEPLCACCGRNNAVGSVVWKISRKLCGDGGNLNGKGFYGCVGLFHDEAERSLDGAEGTHATPRQQCCHFEEAD